MTPSAPTLASAPESNPKRLGRLIVYWFPLIVWTIVLFRYGAGERGRYENSLYLVQHAIHFLTPDLPYEPNSGGLITTWSMYQINDAFRRLAHVAVYALLTFLIVRAIQQGQTRLKLASIIAAVLGSALYVVADELKRAHETHRHAKPEDIILNAIGVSIILGGTLLFFGIKSLERRLSSVAGSTAAPVLAASTPGDRASSALVEGTETTTA